MKNTIIYFMKKNNLKKKRPIFTDQPLVNHVV